MECGILWFNCSLIQSLWTFVEGVFLRLKGRNIKFTSKPCEQNLPDPSGIIAVEYGKPPLKVDSLFDGIMENQCKQWIKNAVDSISTRETHAITKNPIDTYPLNILNCYCKVLGPIFQGNPYMTSYSPPPWLMGGSRVGTPGAGTQSKPWVEPHPMKQAEPMGLRWFTWTPPIR